MNSLAHIGHAVSDMETSLKFYTELIGFRFDRELNFTNDQIQDLLVLKQPKDMRVIYLLLAGFTLELMEMDPAAVPHAGSRDFTLTGITHFSFVVDDPADIYARVEDFGGTRWSDIGIANMIRDPDGQLIELLPPTYPDSIEEQRQA
ncbi:MAG: VOC family protein [Novosphingobium sp.]|nr:VOC family protein [Novosphingobium sp.]